MRPEGVRFARGGGDFGFDRTLAGAAAGRAVKTPALMWSLISVSKVRVGHISGGRLGAGRE